jgi:hypothetical protein
VATFIRRIEDSDDVLGMGCAMFAVEIDYEIVGGDPGCRRDANGDGWPAEPDSVLVTGWRVVAASMAAGSSWLFGGRARVNAFIGEAIERDHAEIETEILESASAEGRSDG